MSFSTKSIASVVLVLASIAIGYFALMPGWTSYTSAKTVLTAKKAEKAKLEEGQAQLTNFLNEYKQHAADAARLNQALPLSKTELYNVLNNLDVISKQSGFALAGLSIVETPETDSFGATVNSVQPIDLAFSVSGSYAGFRNLLTTLETNLRLMDISNLTLAASDDVNLMSFNLKFRTYYQK